MKLIVGLGNPGQEYDRTRHNVGFEAVDALARRHAPEAMAKARFHGLVVEAMLDLEKVLLVRPTTYMNRSGQCVIEALQFYKLDPAEDLLVIVDEFALECGRIRLRARGSAGGHNGLSDIERRLGTSEYARLRIGIDPPGEIPMTSYVLGKFRPDQRTLVDESIDEAARAAAVWANEGITAAMNQFNPKKIA